MEYKRITIGPVRLSYAHLFKPYSNDRNVAPKFSTVMLIPTSDARTIGEVRQAIADVIPQNAPKGPDGKIDTNRFNIPLKNGHEKNSDGRHPEYEGMMVMNAASKADRAPLVVKKVRTAAGTLQTVPCPETEIYSGCWAYVNINLAPYAVSGKQGVTAYLNSVCLARQDTALGTTNNPDADFAAVDTESQVSADPLGGAPASPAPAPVDDLPWE